MSAPREPTAAAGGGRSRRLLIGLALAYPASLLLLVLVLRTLAERWWFATLLLYLPRVLFGLPLPILAFLAWRRGPRRMLLPAQGLALLVLIFPLMGFVLPGPTGADPSAPVLRVLSYNVMHAYAGAERIVAEIDRFQPDVVLLQKLNTNSEPVERLLGARYPVVEISTTGFLLASRFPVRSRAKPEDIVFDGEVSYPRYYQWELETPLGPIAFYDVHPNSPREGLFAVVRRGQSAPALLREESALRVLQVRSFAARADRERIPVVIAGDTNVAGLSPLLHRELGRYRDGFRSAGWGFGYTFPHGPFPWMRIDRVLTSPALEVVRFARGDSTASDHRCVVADLQRAVTR